jgi:hypothetical protein
MVVPGAATLQLTLQGGKGAGSIEVGTLPGHGLAGGMRLIGQAAPSVLGRLGLCLQHHELIANL